MVKSTRKNFVKGAASFALLLALGAGLGAGNLMAALSEEPPVHSRSINVGPAQMVVGNNINDTLQFSAKPDSSKIDGTSVIGISVSAKEVCACQYKSGRCEYMAGSQGQEKFNYFLSGHIKNLLPGIRYVEASSDICVKEFHEAYKVNHDLNKKHPGLVPVRGQEGQYTTVNPGALSRFKPDGSLYVYTDDAGEKTSFIDDEYGAFKQATLSSYIIYLLNITQLCPGMQAFWKNANERMGPGVKKAIISLTCSEDIRGDERDCLLTALKCVSEAYAGEGACECKIVPSSVATQIGFSYDFYLKPSNAGRKIVTLDYGYSGFSICSGKKDGGNLVINKDKYVVGCGIKAEEDAILELIKRRCKDYGLEAKFNSHLSKPEKRLALLNKIKRVITVPGDEVHLEYNFFEDNDVDSTITRDDIKKILYENGILQHLENELTQYIVGLGDEWLSDGDEIQLPSDIVFFPWVKEILNNVLRKANKKVHFTIKSESGVQVPVMGAFYAFINGDTSGDKRSDAVFKADRFVPVDDAVRDSLAGFLKEAGFKETFIKKLKEAIDNVTWNSNYEEPVANVVENVVANVEKEKSLEYEKLLSEEYDKLKDFGQVNEQTELSVQGEAIASRTNKNRDVLSIDFGGRNTLIATEKSGYISKPRSQSTKLYEDLDTSFRIGELVKPEIYNQNTKISPDEWLVRKLQNVGGDDVSGGGVPWAEYLVQVNVSNDIQYCAAPNGILEKVYEQDGRHFYKMDNGETVELDGDKYRQLEKCVWVSHLARGKRALNAYPAALNFLNLRGFDTTGKPIISFILGGSVQGREKSICVDALRCLCEARGNIGEIDAGILAKVRGGNTDFEYNITSSGVSGQFELLKNKDEKPKVSVLVDYGYNGFSICGGEVNGVDLKLHKDKYVRGCAGKAIDDAILGLLKKRCEDMDIRRGMDVNDEGSVTFKFNKLLSDDTKRFKIMQKIEVAKGGLSSCDTMEIDLDLLEYNDVNTCITSDDMAAILKDKGIIKTFMGELERYIDENFGDSFGKDDGVKYFLALRGGTSRIPVLRNAVKVLMKKKGVKIGELDYTASGDDSCATGACDGAAFYDIKPIKAGASSPVEVPILESDPVRDGEIIKSLKELRMHSESGIGHFIKLQESKFLALSNCLQDDALSSVVQPLRKGDLLEYAESLTSHLNMSDYDEHIISCWIASKDPNFNIQSSIDSIDKAIEAFRGLEDEEKMNEVLGNEVTKALYDLSSQVVSHLRSLKERVTSLSDPITVTAGVHRLLSVKPSSALSESLQAYDWQGHAEGLLEVVKDAKNSMDEIFASQTSLSSFVTQLSSCIKNVVEWKKDVYKLGYIDAANVYGSVVEDLNRVLGECNSRIQIANSKIEELGTKITEANKKIGEKKDGLKLGLTQYISELDGEDLEGLIARVRDLASELDVSVDGLTSKSSAEDIVECVLRLRGHDGSFTSVLNEATCLDSGKRHGLGLRFRARYASDKISEKFNNLIKFVADTKLVLESKETLERGESFGRLKFVPDTKFANSLKLLLKKKCQVAWANDLKQEIERVM